MFSEPTKFQVKVFTVLFLSSLFLEWTLIHFQILKRFSPSENVSPETLPNSKLEQALAPTPKKVVIGMVSCQWAEASEPEAFMYRMRINEEAVVTIKSILISARLHGVSQVDFHIFVEKPSDPAWFHRELARNGWAEDAGVEVTLYFHSAVNVVPDKFKRQMVYHVPYRCGFVRMFFPNALPEVDSIIYLDTDMMLTGNIGDLWNRLGRMGNQEVIGIARNNEPENHFVDHRPGFGDLLLHEKAPKGLNSGMLVMNLTRMRAVNWQERFLRIYEDFSKIYINMEDQRTLNIFAYFDPGQLHLIPCQFDIMHTHCDFGWMCSPALKDPHGIHVIHGAGNQFEDNGRFKSVFRAYQFFSWTGNPFNHSKKPVTSVEQARQIFVEKVAKPVKKSYELDNRLGRSRDNLKTDSKCYGTLNRLLYKNFA